MVTAQRVVGSARGHVRAWEADQGGEPESREKIMKLLMFVVGMLAALVGALIWGSSATEGREAVEPRAVSVHAAGTDASSSREGAEIPGAARAADGEELMRHGAARKWIASSAEPVRDLEAELADALEDNAKWRSRASRLVKENNQLIRLLQDCTSYEGSPYGALAETDEGMELSPTARHELSNLLWDFPVYLDPGEATRLWESIQRHRAEGYRSSEAWIPAIREVLGSKRIVESLRSNHWNRVWRGFFAHEIEALIGEEYPELYEEQLALYSDLWPDDLVLPSAGD